MPRNRIRLIILVVLILVAAVGGLWWWTRLDATSVAIILQGNVEVRQVNLAFKVAGRIKELAVDEGDTVQAGQMLASLDKVYFEEAIAQTRAQRDQSVANLARMEAGNRPEEIAQAEALVAEREATLLNTKITLDRTTELRKTGAVSQQSHDNALAAYRQADAQLNSARQAMRLMKIGFRKEDIENARGQLAERDAQLLIAQRELTDAELAAPSAGVVLSRVREAGAIVNAGETVFVISLTNPVWVRTYVSELDLGHIRPGMTVDVLTDTPRSARLRGRIGFISPTAEFTPRTVETRELRTSLVYRVRINVDDPSGSLRQGMPVSVSVPPLPADYAHVASKPK
jgi:HlyD family secretion protein